MGPDFTGCAGVACVAFFCAVGAASAAFFFFVGISAFRALETAALATAAVLSFELSFGGEAGFATDDVVRRRAAALTLDVAFCAGFEATFGVAVFADVTLRAAAAGLAALAVLARSGVPGFAAALAEVPDFISIFFDLAGLATVFEAEREMALAERADDVPAVPAGFAFAAVGFVEAVALTAVRAFVRFALDLALLAALPRGAAAAFAFGGMVDHSSWRGR